MLHFIDTSKPFCISHCAFHHLQSLVPLTDGEKLLSSFLILTVSSSLVLFPQVSHNKENTFLINGDGARDCMCFVALSCENIKRTQVGVCLCY